MNHGQAIAAAALWVALAGVTDGAVVPHEFETLAGRSPGMGLGQSECLVGLGGEWIRRMLIRVWDAQTLQASWTAERPELPEFDIAWQGNAIACTVEKSIVVDRPCTDSSVSFPVMPVVS